MSDRNETVLPLLDAIARECGVLSWDDLRRYRQYTLDNRWPTGTDPDPGNVTWDAFATLMDEIERLHTQQSKEPVSEDEREDRIVREAAEQALRPATFCEWCGGDECDNKDLRTMTYGAACKGKGPFG